MTTKRRRRGRPAIDRAVPTTSSGGQNQRVVLALAGRGCELYWRGCPFDRERSPGARYRNGGVLVALGVNHVDAGRHDGDMVHAPDTASGAPLAVQERHLLTAVLLEACCDAHSPSAPVAMASAYCEEGDLRCSSDCRVILGGVTLVDGGAVRP